MKTGFKKITDNYHIIVLLCFLGLMLIIHQHLYLRTPDDNFYNVIAKCDFGKIFEFLKWHYNFKNGRIWLNFCEMLTLRFDVFLWRITNPILFTVLAYFTGGVVTPFFKDKRKAVTAAVIFYLVVDYSYVSSGIFWLSSSFNYLLPMLTFVLALYFYNSKKDVATLFFVILAGFATEQSSMITIGFFVLTILDKVLLKKEYRVIKEFIFTVIAVLGLCTIIFSPATSLRMNMHAVDPSIFSYITRFNDILYLNWFATKNSLSIIILLTTAVTVPVFKFNPKSKLLKFSGRGLLSALIVLCIANLINIVFFESDVALLYYAFLVIFIISTLYSSAILISQRKTLPVMMLILGAGSQIMMSITDKWIFRTCFPGIICFSIFILFVLGENMKPLLNKRKFLIMALSVALLFAVRNLHGDIGYIKENNNGIESYCQEEATLEDYNYVLSNEEDGTFWYEADHEEFFKEKIKYAKDK